VNGVRDVVFDARPALPPIGWLPAALSTPTLPYWLTSPGLSGYWPAGVSWDGTTVSFRLSTSTYDAATKTCTNVACHVAEQRPVWGTPYQYYSNQSATCYTCHPM
jgi:predicted CxxxxCH...CXXCH cytochrome family protein